MNKKLWAMLMAVVMIVSGLMVTATAEDYVLNKLKHSGYAEVGGNTKDMENATRWLGDASYDDYSFWHFVDSSKTSEYAVIEFSGGTVTLYPYKNNQHYAVVTPSDWVLIGGISYATEAGEFNLSHSCRHEPEVGYAVAKADVSAWHNEITPHEYYERTVDDYFVRTVDEYFERTVDAYLSRAVDEYYTRTVDAYYSRPVTETWQRYAQRYLVPVFTKKLEGNYKKETLVSRGGAAFNNGHTCVTVNVEEARKDGVTFGIADSSKKNTPVGYSYTVTINGDKLTVSCDKRLAFASVGAYVFNTIPKKTNAPKHYANTVTVDLPEGYGKTVYLYTHFESLGWYEVDDAGEFVWQFKGWRYDDNRTEYGDYELIDTAYGEYALDRTEYGEYTLANTIYGDYELDRTEYGDYELVNTVYGAYELDHTDYGEYALAATENEVCRVDDAYTGTLALTVDGNAAALGEKITLRPGEHTFVLTGDGIETKTETVTVKAGETATVNFGTQDCHYDDVTLPVEQHHADLPATRHEADLEATRHEADKATVEHFSDREATKHYADLATEKHYADREAEKIYNEAYLWLPDVKLGNETDAYGEYAVRE